MNKNSIILKISKTTNIIALCFIIGGGYGLIFTGILQIIAGIFFTFAHPKNQLIYIYFLFTFLFLMKWGGNIFGWQFIIPGGLIFFLTFIIHFHSRKS